MATGFRPAKVFPETQPFFVNVENRPISAAVTDTGNSHVFRHAVLGAGFP